MQHNEITLHACKAYATEANLRKAISKHGLDSVEDLQFIVSLTPAGKWTAIFLVTNYLNKHGGYAGIAGQHGFMSI